MQSEYDIYIKIILNLLSESSLLSGLGNIANFASNEDDPYITMKNVRTINMQRI